jgi:hypothetical protein
MTSPAETRPRGLPLTFVAWQWAQREIEPET